MPQGHKETRQERRAAAQGPDTAGESGPARVGRYAQAGMALSARPRIGTNVDTTESGPSRLHITPGRPREIEAGPSRKGPFAGQGMRAAVVGPPFIATSTGARESGPARIGRFAAAPARVTAHAGVRQGAPDTREAGPARVDRYRK